MPWFDALIEYVTYFLTLPEYALPVLFLWSVASATALPLGSEVMLLTYVNVNPHQTMLVLFLATIGNTLGGMINYYLAFKARKITAKSKLSTVQSSALFVWTEKLGAKILFFSFIPIVGDPLTLLAGWLKLPWLACMLWQAAGKLLRYVVVLFAAQQITTWF
jgi:membrane protein YqaA with SNARE-associated domain